MGGQTCLTSQLLSVGTHWLSTGCSCRRWKMTSFWQVIKLHSSTVCLFPWTGLKTALCLFKRKTRSYVTYCTISNTTADCHWCYKAEMWYVNILKAGVPASFFLLLFFSLLFFFFPILYYILYKKLLYVHVWLFNLKLHAYSCTSIDHTIWLPVWIATECLIVIVNCYYCYWVLSSSFLWVIFGILLDSFI